MRLSLALLALAALAAGCDLVYERQPQFDLDFGIPYDIVVTEAPESAAGRASPLLDGDGVLHLTVTYYERCDGHAFSLEHRAPNERFAQVWVRHAAPVESCRPVARVQRALLLPLPDALRGTPEVVLIGPGNEEFVLREG